MTDMNRRSALRTGLFGAVAATAAGTVGMAHAAAPAAEMGVKISDEEAVRRIFSTRSQFLAKEIDEF